MNWRKPVIGGLLRLSNPAVLRELELIRQIEYDPVLAKRTQEDRLARLLEHAWAQVPYYREVLESCGAVRAGRADLGRFCAIPFLTKDIIRAQADRLRARILPEGRRAYQNASGGSTGQPVTFWQDNRYWASVIATRLYHFSMLGKDLGEREMKIWGSGRDLEKGMQGFTARAQNWLYNRRSEQCYHLPEERIQEILRKIDAWRPQLIWCYRDGIDAIAKYVNQRGLRPHSPKAVVLGGATVYPDIARAIEQAFRAPAISAYGSREVGAAACQCLQQDGHHVATNVQVVEVIDAREQPTVGEDGEIIITSLDNFAMPLIRYRIGDRGRLTDRRCVCGRAFPLLDALSGRLIEVLVNSRGEQIDPIYLVMLLGVELRSELIRKFQIVQEEDRSILLNIVLETGATPESAREPLAHVERRLHEIIGATCAVRTEFVPDIPLTASGKHPYVIRRASLDAHRVA